VCNFISTKTDGELNYDGRGDEWLYTGAHHVELEDEAGLLSLAPTAYDETSEDVPV
jgi:hypothetical protein